MNQNERSVLVVSTDLEILRALSHALALCGYAVTTAMEWHEVMEKLVTGTVSVVLYDVKDLDRGEWTRLVGLQAAYLGFPVIMFASLESSELDRALSEGLIAGYQVKPIYLTALEECLERVGAERQPASSISR
jgi:DNA-binding NtrC family response regulator